MQHPVSIASIGELLVEFVCATKNGRNRTVAAYQGPFPSGAPGIFIDQAALIGGRAIFVGAVGGDAFGKVMLDQLERRGVALDLIRTIPDRPTGSAFVSYNDDGSRDFVFNIAHSAAPLFLDEATILKRLRDARLDIMHISGSSLPDPRMAKAILAICDALHAEGVRISFDPNVRKELANEAGYLTSVRKLVAISTYFLPSEEDAAVLFPNQRFDDYAGGLLLGQCEYVVLKRGAEGCRGLTRTGERADFPAHKVTVLDPTGAGDCFCATLVALAGSKTHSFAEALRRANAAGALATTKVGPMEGNRNLADIERFLKGGMAALA
jgi:sugar/nucleoside kinase (ribokinase family)